ncbi:hypothetical protein R3W88_024378 [Solanum pinnatisectum]|uniref:Uncharacterized protein n=1 Tax=Solanum pinnatisectum TaxID=50273 RepID=A0AAV9M3E7_9SOLN|nr:hypothetical protein R3W88_024378 [Solanum pinnatisectum]
MEASMLNQIRKLERQNSPFLFSKAKREYWSEVKTTLHNCGSQKEYYRLLCFENRDLKITAPSIDHRPILPLAIFFFYLWYP